MQPARIMKEVQRLTARVVALKCFISQETKECEPFFKVLHGKCYFPMTKTMRKYLKN